MIEAVIFDFGGVITASPAEAFRRLEAEKGLPRDFIRRVNATAPDSNAWARLERSEIDHAAFDALFAQEAARLGHSLRGADVLAALAGGIRAEMVAALDRLAKAGYRLGCITNNARGARGPGMARSPEIAALYARAFARFEHVIESSRVGVRKPDPRIYAMMCEAMDLPPCACAYLDDLGVNCTAAAAMGMRAIEVSSASQALRDLSAILELDLSA